ncbi:AMP-binding protein [Anaeromicropila populeti]|uniref:Long-chain acyl-CoA synthetase n=1 Tax=Anaeromicropila populeti TaxID=37658 RepID=A0A1I6L0J6_9FIRM|nr:AMP-binding protein [Anaeromicropila populeti]SFR96971.1 long-chain acyl-CoA synthetase [Anaeromicropila populeti]
MKLENIKEYMSKNKDSYLEYFERGHYYKKRYEEVLSDVLKLVSFINEKKVKKQERIGIVGTNSYAWVLADLACLIGGWVSVTFHEKNFEMHKEQLINQFDVKLVFMDEKYFDEKADDIYIQLSLIPQIIEKFEPSVIEGAAFTDEDIFTIIFTSGTTGTPKALSIKIEGTSHFITGVCDLFQFNNSDKLFIFLPLSVLTCRTYIYGALLHNFHIALSTMDTFSLAMKKTQPTVMQGVPYLFETIHDTFYNMLRESKFKLFFVNILFGLNNKNLIPKKMMRAAQNKFFKEFHNFWGGKMRLMITGSASISANIIRFYQNTGINLYEAYATNEAGLLTINYPGKCKIGSVGTTFVGREIIISDEGEILIKSDNLAYRYEMESDEFNSRVFRSDGYIATGDMGFFDKEGFLFLRGRIKDIITMSNGEKVMPGAIENKLKESPLIKQVCIYGEKSPFLTAIVTKGNPKVTKEMIENELEKYMSELKEVSKIKQIIFTSEPFSIENKLLNVNMKMDRNKIFEQYKKELAEIYTS